MKRIRKDFEAAFPIPKTSRTIRGNFHQIAETTRRIEREILPGRSRSSIRVASVPRRPRARCLRRGRTKQERAKVPATAAAPRTTKPCPDPSRNPRDSSARKRRIRRQEGDWGEQKRDRSRERSWVGTVAVLPTATFYCALKSSAVWRHPAFLYGMVLFSGRSFLMDKFNMPKMTAFYFLLNQF